jgi:hypothetical protein
MDEGEDDDRLLVFVSKKRDRGELVVEEWAAKLGCIVANIRKVGERDTVLVQGIEIKREPDTDIWLADIVISERERDCP